MNTHSEFDDDEAEMNRLLGEHLAPLPVTGAKRQAMRGRLLDRVGRSLASLAGVAVVRQAEGAWRNLLRGVRVKHLWHGPAGSSVLIDIAPGAELPGHRHAYLEEGLILAGGLQVGDLDLVRGDYQVSPPGSRHRRMSASDEGCVAFLRGTALGRTGTLVGELVGGLLPVDGPAATLIRSAEGAWRPIAPGVEEKVLCQAAAGVSRLLRLQRGAALPARQAGAEEECLLLEGDAFFDDLLLCAGDFLQVPAANRHGTLVSDRGAVLFLHGAGGEGA